MTLACYTVTTQLSLPLNLVGFCSDFGPVFIETTTDFNFTATPSQVFHLTGNSDAIALFPGNTLVYCDDEGHTSFANGTGQIIICA